MMKRKKFIGLGALSLASFITKNQAKAMETTPKQFFFKDDGKIPNNKFPLLVYKNVFAKRGDDGAQWLEEKFAANNWTNAWRNGIYPYHHYHSTTHEALGIYSGSALLHLGGEKGEGVEVSAGDILVIPAGVGHKNLGDKNSFGVVGAYPNGRSWDVLRGEKGERPKADETIASLPVPDSDPLLGANAGLILLWKKP